MRTESTSRSLARVTLTWPSHISCKCITMAKLHQTSFNLNRKSIHAKNTGKRYSSTTLSATNSSIWRYTDLWTRREFSKRATKLSYWVKSILVNFQSFNKRPSSKHNLSMKALLQRLEWTAKWDFTCGWTRPMTWIHRRHSHVAKRRRSSMSTHSVPRSCKMTLPWVTSISHCLS